MRHSFVTFFSPVSISFPISVSLVLYHFLFLFLYHFLSLFLHHCLFFSLSLSLFHSLLLPLSQSPSLILSLLTFSISFSAFPSPSHVSASSLSALLPNEGKRAGRFNSRQPRQYNSRKAEAVTQATGTRQPAFVRLSHHARLSHDFGRRGGS